MWIFSATLVAKLSFCFNRYMVECEFVNDADCFFCIHSFNRYMVECEYNNKNNHSYDHKCFNRYMVECEWQ